MSRKSSFTDRSPGKSNERSTPGNVHGYHVNASQDLDIQGNSMTYHAGRPNPRGSNQPRDPYKHPYQDMSNKGVSYSPHDEWTTPRDGPIQWDPQQHSSQTMTNPGVPMPHPDQHTVSGGVTHQKIPNQKETEAKETELQQLKARLERRDAELSQLKEEREVFKNKYVDLLWNAMGRDGKATQRPAGEATEGELVKAWQSFRIEMHGKAFGELRKKLGRQVDRGQIGKILLDCCQAIYSHCIKEEKQFRKNIRDSLAHFSRVPQNEENLLKTLTSTMKKGQGQLLTLTDREVKKTVEGVMEIFRRSSTFLGDLEGQVLEEILQQRMMQAAPAEKPGAPWSTIQRLLPSKYQNVTNACSPYLLECHHLCRRMLLHMPAMHLDFQVVEGSKVDYDKHDVLNRDPGSGLVYQLLVPALYRSRDGDDLLVKGLVFSF